MRTDAYPVRLFANTLSDEAGSLDAFCVSAFIDTDIPTPHHGNDGLIYTRVSTPYTPGADRNMRIYSHHSSELLVPPT